MANEVGAESPASKKELQGDSTLTGPRPSPTSMLRERTKDEQNLIHSHQLLPLKKRNSGSAMRVVHDLSRNRHSKNIPSDIHSRVRISICSQHRIRHMVQSNSFFQVIGLDCLRQSVMR
jgi:hypothetical protein